MSIRDLLGTESSAPVKSYQTFLEKLRLHELPGPTFVILAALALLVSPQPTFPADQRDRWEQKAGPISLVNLSPIQLLFLQGLPDRAETLPRGHGSLGINTSLTNTLLAEKAGEFEGVIDMEMVRTSVNVRYGIAPSLEMAVSIPLVYSYSGILDRMILDVEEFFDAVRDVRREQQPDRYMYAVKRNNEAFIAGKGRRCSGVGDVVLQSKAKITDEGRSWPGFSARLAAKIPTGDTDRALGSGKADYGLGILLQKGIDGLALYLNADVIFPGEAFDHAAVSLKEFYELMFGGEYKINPRFSVLLQANYMTRPFKNTGLQMLDKRIIDILLGFHYLLKGGILIQGGAVEDILDSADAGADITFFLNLRKNF